jgi:hypothetical protein
MLQRDYLNRFEDLSREHFALTERKNKDYAGEDNPFRNFELIEVLTNGRISTADGILVRMSDKIQRVANLLAKDPDVVGESILDSLDDLSIYAKILRIHLEEQINPLPTANETLPDPEPVLEQGPAKPSILASFFKR